jgi:hypothetical protein
MNQQEGDVRGLIEFTKWRQLAEISLGSRSWLSRAVGNG